MAIGDRSDIQPGRLFASRRELFDAGVHRAPQAGGVGARAMGAESIVLSGGYAEDDDYGDIVIHARTAQGTVAHLLHLRGVDYDSGVALPAKPVHIRGWPDWLPRARPGHPAAPAVISKADTPWQRSDSGSG